MIDETAYPTKVVDVLKKVARNEEELEGLLYEFEERAAIREFDGGQPREEAEKAALTEVLSRHQNHLK